MFLLDQNNLPDPVVAGKLVGKVRSVEGRVNITECSRFFVLIKYNDPILHYFRKLNEGRLNHNFQFLVAL